MLGLIASCLVSSSLATHAFRATCDIFVLKDCPVANQYAPEIKRIIQTYRPKGVQFLMYFEDQDVSLAQATKHANDYGIQVSTTIDKKNINARRLHVTTSPTAVVTTPDGKILYEGRIDNTYASVSQRRRSATTHELRDALDAVVAGKPVKVSNAAAVGCRLY